MATNDSFISSPYNDFFLFENGDGSDTVDGGAGTDMVSYDDNTTDAPVYAYVDNGTIWVGRGADVDKLINIETLVGTDSLTDTLDVSSVIGNVSVNLAAGTVSGAGGLTSVTQFEYVLAGSGNDTLVGNDNANWLVGGNGNDTITGGLGGDYLDGGAGNDLFNETAGNGADTIDGGAGTDTVSYDDNDASAPIYTYLLDGTAYVGRSGQTDILSNIETIVGTDSAADVLDLSSDTDGETVDLLNGTVTGVAGLSAISQFEYVMSGSGNDNLYGNDAANYLVGGDGKDTMNGDNGGDYLDGQDGDDNLYGWFGTDTLVGGDGNDVLDGGADNDTLLGGLGDDYYQYSTIDGNDLISDDGGTDQVLLLGANFHYWQTNWFATDSNGDGNLDALKIDFGTTGTLTIQNYFDDTTSNINALSQGSGYIESLDIPGTNIIGPTHYDFAAVKNAVAQSSGLLVQGTDQDEALTGSAGNDVLIGGVGDDSLAGGNGNDTYEFSTFDGHDNFNVALYDGQDVINDTGGGQDKVILYGLGQFMNINNMALFKTANGDLQIGYLGSPDAQLTIEGQFNGSGQQIETFYNGGGYYMTASDVNQVIADMSSYAASHGISVNSLSDVENNAGLLNIINAGWHQ